MRRVAFGFIGLAFASPAMAQGVPQTDTEAGVDVAPITEQLTMTLKFGIAGKNNGTTTFTGATQAAGRFDYTLTYAVPAPGAAALVGLAGMIVRRRSRA